MALSSPSISKQSRHQPETVKSGEILEQLHLQTSLDAVIIRTTVRKLAASLGFSLVDQVRIATAIFEIAYNLVTYAGQGEIIISWLEEEGHSGLEFFCHDRGLNASELTSVLETNEHDPYGYMNLLGLKKLADKFKFERNRRYGNSVTAVIWKE